MTITYSLNTRQYGLSSEIFICLFIRYQCLQRTFNAMEIFFQTLSKSIYGKFRQSLSSVCEFMYIVLSSQWMRNDLWGRGRLLRLAFYIFKTTFLDPGGHSPSNAIMLPLCFRIKCHLLGDGCFTGIDGLLTSFLIQHSVTVRNTVLIIWCLYFLKKKVWILINLINIKYLILIAILSTYNRGNRRQLNFTSGICFQFWFSIVFDNSILPRQHLLYRCDKKS